eukprot:SAG22_NODE_7805_length_707_cov_0.799342_1_plen_125_part_00
MAKPATALYRCYDSYHLPPAGHFEAVENTTAAAADGRSGGGPSLQKIWDVGAETTRSCCEDSCIDGPCRERGMWLGDTAAVTLPNLPFMYDGEATVLQWNTGGLSLRVLFSAFARGSAHTAVLF